jgi:RNA polymerase sigma-70 factor (ECF subfamily)
MMLARAEAVVPNVVRLRRATTAEETSDPSGTSDAALVQFALRDRQAFGLLYDRYVSPVYRYCYGRLNDREQAEDATSLVFARALAALPSQRGPSVRSWLFAIAHNVVINMRRDASPDRPLDDAFDLPDPGPSPDELAAEAERRSSGSWALTQLPEEQRRVVELRLAGMTGPEVAEAIGRSHDSVRTTQRRALVRLRVLLGIAPATEEGRDAS